MMIAMTIMSCFIVRAVVSIVVMTVNRNMVGLNVADVIEDSVTIATRRRKA